MKQKKQKPLSDETKIHKVANNVDKKAKTIAKKANGEVSKNEKSKPSTAEAANLSLAEKSQASNAFGQLLPPTSLMDPQPSTETSDKPQPLTANDTLPDSAPAQNPTPENRVSDATSQNIAAPRNANEPPVTSVTTHGSSVAAADDTATPVGAAETTPPPETHDGNTSQGKELENETNPLQKLSDEELENTVLAEVAWEVCNQVGGIYTVIQSKVPATKLKWDNNYLLLGPNYSDQAAAIFQPDKSLYDETDPD
jgi:hypothetical protein